MIPQKTFTEENNIEEPTNTEEKEGNLGLTPNYIHIHELSKKISQKSCLFCDNKKKEKESFMCKKCNLLLCENCASFISSDNKKKKFMSIP